MGENARWLAQGFLIQTLTGEPIYLGLAGLATALPSLAFSFVGGAIADRVDRRKVLLCTTTVSGSLTAFTALLVFSDLIQPWHVLAIAFALGTVFAFDAPARQALLPHLVAREDMASAVAINSAVWQGNRILGPVVAGLLIATVGIGFSYVVTSAGYLVGFVLISRLALPATAKGMSRGSMSANIKVGLRFIRSSPLFGAMIGLSFMTRHLWLLLCHAAARLRTRYPRCRCARLRGHGDIRRRRCRPGHAHDRLLQAGPPQRSHAARRRRYHRCLAHRLLRLTVPTTHRGHPLLCRLRELDLSQLGPDHRPAPLP